MAGIERGTKLHSHLTGDHLEPAVLGARRSISAIMSCARQQVVRGPSLTGFGKRPLLTPDHQVEGQTGTKAKTCGKRSSAAESI
jgi:hypothetical protein